MVFIVAQINITYLSFVPRFEPITMGLATCLFSLDILCIFTIFFWKDQKSVIASYIKLKML